MTLIAASGDSPLPESGMSSVAPPTVSLPISRSPLNFPAAVGSKLTVMTCVPGAVCGLSGSMAGSAIGVLEKPVTVKAVLPVTLIELTFSVASPALKR